MRDLAGKVALVTGAANGIGRGLVEAMAAAGMAIVAADVDSEGLAAMDEALAQGGARRLTQVLDIRDRHAWSELLARAEMELGPVQLLCNNAGVVAPFCPMLDLPPETWDWIVETNLTGAFNGIQTVGSRMRALQVPGHIVNMSSVQGLLAAAGFGSYNAAKFGIVGLSETLRLELAPLNIGVSVVCPGPTRTRIMANSARMIPRLSGPTNPPRAGFTIYQTPAEVAEKVLDAVRANRLYVITHPEYAPVFEARAAALRASLRPASTEAIDNVLSVEAEMLGLYEAAARAAAATLPE
jgi:NAD(P)-dependent dehydrogenase (short-subunit alcohol dehydrogenase family)